jgi:bifunctional non-homologous end joining protein LigD
MAVASKLKTYRSKRNATKTPEPVPRSDRATGGPGRTFVIQEHHARALHWDFRLQHDGVLVSWAVPKNLPVDPASNHLAVQTEDHPLEYATFEGKIPAGEYGGGTVTIWDHGTYECEKWSDREIKIVLAGSRVNGRYVLFKTGSRERDWMVHRMDAPAEGFTAMPDRIAPMLASLVTDLPADDDAWGYEFKWDGVRAVVYVDGGRARAMSRNDNDITATYPELRAMAASIGSRQLVLDGELVAFDADGRPSFAALQPRMHLASTAAITRLARQTPVTFLAFDLLYLDGRSLLDAPYEARRQALDELKLTGDSWQTPPWFAGNGDAVWRASKEQRLEGIVIKRLASTYAPGSRSGDWLKLKNQLMQEVVIAGWKPGTGSREGAIGSLMLGVPDDAGHLSYVGNVGTGFTDAALRSLAAALMPLQADVCPFSVPPPRSQTRDARWVRPILVGEVRFSEWTREGRLRHPAWRGLRPDKAAEEVRRES